MEVLKTTSPERSVRAPKLRPSKTVPSSRASMAGFNLGSPQWVGFLLFEHDESGALASGVLDLPSAFRFLNGRRFVRRAGRIVPAATTHIEKRLLCSRNCPKTFRTAKSSPGRLLVLGRAGVCRG